MIGKGGQTGEGRRTGRGEGLRGETDREGEQTGRGDRQGGGTYIGVGTRCRSSVVASFAIRQQGVISVGVVPHCSLLLSGVGIVVHGWGIIIWVGARSASRFAQSSFVGAGSSFVCGAHHSWVCRGWWLSLVGFHVLFVVRGCRGRCVNGCWGWCVGVVVRQWGVGWKVASTWHTRVPRQRFGSCVKRGEGEGVILLTSTLSVMRGVVVCRWH